MIEAVPSWSPSTAYAANVAGSNCIGPSAPADDGPSLRPWPLSTWPIDARIVQGRPGQVVAADLYSARNCAEGGNTCRPAIADDDSVPRSTVSAASAAS